MIMRLARTFQYTGNCVMPNKMDHYGLIGDFKRTGKSEYLDAYYKHENYTQHYRNNRKRKWILKYELLAKIVKDLDCNSVLDVGCATKTIALEAFEPDVSYFGFDINPDFRPEYVGNANYISTVVDRRFDAIVLSDILEHVAEPRKVLCEAMSVADYLVIVVPQWYRLECLPIPTSWRYEFDRHIHVGGWRFWRKVIESQSLRVTKIKGYFYYPSIAFNSRLKILVSFDKWCQNNWFFHVINDILTTYDESPIVRTLGQELIVVISTENGSSGHTSL